jgi:hypothetical protein
MSGSLAYHGFDFEIHAGQLSAIAAVIYKKRTVVQNPYSDPKNLL